MTAPAEPLKLTPPWAYYRRTGLSEMRPYVPSEDMTGISVSDADRHLIALADNQGLDPGGYIARNPKNHADQWYMAQAYFDENLEPADTPARDDAAELRAALERFAAWAYRWEGAIYTRGYEALTGTGSAHKELLVAMNRASAALAASEGEA